MCAATALLLLAPQPPLLFMGQEWGTRSPFLYFCDLGADLAQAVTEGRRQEFARFSEFADPESRACIPDPLAPETFLQSRLDRAERDTAEGRRWLVLHAHLLDLRRSEIVPRLRGMPPGARFARSGARGLAVEWRLGDGSRLSLVANLGAESAALPLVSEGRRLFAIPETEWTDGALPPWSVAWFIEES